MHVQQAFQGNILEIRDTKKTTLPKHHVGVLFLKNQTLVTVPRDPITLSDDDWGVQSPPKRKVFRFHYHSQKVIGSLGYIYTIAR